MDGSTSASYEKKEILSVESQRLTRASAAMLHPYEDSSFFLAEEN